MFTWKLKNLLFRIIHPNFWLSNYSVDWEYDAWLKNLLENGEKVKVIDHYYAEVRGKRLWVTNYPYAYGGVGPRVGFLPSPLTRVMLRKAVNKATYN